MTRTNIHVAKSENRQDNSRSEKGYSVSNNREIEKTILAARVRQPHPVKGQEDLGVVGCSWYDRQNQTRKMRLIEKSA